jgi:hypothetical protein
MESSSCKTQGPTKESLESSNTLSSAILHHRARRGAPGNCVKACSLDLDVAWSSWTRVRGHLGGGSILALANGAKACMSASSDVKLMFKSILAAETEKKAA